MQALVLKPLTNWKPPLAAQGGSIVVLLSLRLNEQTSDFCVQRRPLVGEEIHRKAAPFYKLVQSRETNGLTLHLALLQIPTSHF